MLKGWRRNGTKFQCVTRTDGETRPRRDLHASALWPGDYRELPGVPAPGRAAVLQSARGVSKGFVYNHFVGIVSRERRSLLRGSRPEGYSFYAAVE